MKSYPSYKDSGVEWIGEIPSHWEIVSLKYKDDIIMGQSPSSSSYCAKNQGVPFLQGNADFKEIHPRETVWSNEVNKIAQVNDVLISVRAPIGAVNLADKQYGIGRGLAAIRSLSSYYKYIFYKMISSHSILNSYGTGSTYKAISTEVLANFKSPIPPLPEQTAIADFLDQKTAEIDLAVEKGEERIRLLKEYRAAVIHEAVTRGVPADIAGIDQGIEMKESGIEYIGEIPEHWEVKKLKYAIKNITGGGTPSKNNSSFWNGTIPWV